MRSSTIGLLVLILTLMVAPARAQHPIEVQRLSASGDHLQAMAAWEAMPIRTRTTSAAIAAGRSAWALSLPTVAQQHFDTALKDSTLSQRKRAQILFSKAILFHQEAQPELALLWSDRALAEADDQITLKARIHTLRGQTFLAQNRLAAAEHELAQALETSADVDMAEINFYLGTTQLRLGKLIEAKSSFEHIPLSNERAPFSIRMLATIAAQRGEMMQATFWLERGRMEFPDQFLDGWVDFILMEAAIASGDQKRVAELRSSIAERLPPSDHWRAMAEAAAEVAHWNPIESKHIKAHPNLAEVSNE